MQRRAGQELAPKLPTVTVLGMRSFNVGDWVGVVGPGGRVEGPYKIRAFQGMDAEVVCVRSGRRMLVLLADLRPNPGR
jgi:hypothetical protein